MGLLGLVSRVTIATACSTACLLATVLVRGERDMVGVLTRTSIWGDNSHTLLSSISLGPCLGDEVLLCTCQTYNI